jgi:hypothetical protein
VLLDNQHRSAGSLIVRLQERASSEALHIEAVEAHANGPEVPGSSAPLPPAPAWPHESVIVTDVPKDDVDELLKQVVVKIRVMVDNVEETASARVTPRIARSEPY